MHADIGDHEQAFRAYQLANALAKRWTLHAGQGFQPAQWHQYVERIADTFDDKRLAEGRRKGRDEDVAILIVGMPRSGTTLVEQILSSHPRLHGAGELTWLSEIAQSLPAAYPEGATRIDADTAKSLGGYYLDRLREFAGDAVRITDKAPVNFLHLGLMALLLPNTRVIHCRRNPLDTCLSCYFTNFTHGHSFTNDFSDLATYYRGYRRLMDHWQEVRPLDLIEVDYESLVADQEGVSRRLVEFCGLDWDPRCLRFHENGRPVATASKLQVREKLFSSSVGRWRVYQRFLTPLIEALGEHAAATPRSDEGGVVAEAR
jgi:hypothetical protein